MASVERTIGRLEASITALQEIVGTLTGEVKILKSQRDKGVGAIKAVIIMGTVVSSTFGAVGALAINYFQGQGTLPKIEQVAFNEIHARKN